MNKLFLYLLLISICACDLQKKEARSLISVDELSNLLLSKPNVQLIDVRHPDEFMSGHIPGAINVWSGAFQKENDKMKNFHISKTAFEDLLGNMGLNSRDSIYIYDANGNYDAAQLWWLLNYFGFNKTALIDGGLISWQLSKKNVRAGYADVTPQSFVFVQENKKDFVTNKQKIIDGHFEQIIDNRTAEEYDGKVIKNGAFRGGHIPNALLLNPFEMIQPNSFKLKTAAQIQLMLEEKGGNIQLSTVLYGHNAWDASLSAFIFMEILGMKNVSVYNGSWIEWSEDENLPIEKTKN